MHKGTTQEYLYLIGIILIGIAAIIIATRFVSPSQSIEGRSFKLAAKIALYANSLSSVEAGYAEIIMDGKYSLQIVKKGGKYYAVVTGYKKETGTENYKKSDKPQEVEIIAYRGLDGYSVNRKIKTLGERICIKKEHDKKRAVVKWEKC